MLHRVTQFFALSLLIFSGQALSKDETIWFHFKHEPSSSQVRLSFHVTKGVHETWSRHLFPGETESGKTTNSIFAPTPSGTYHIELFCTKSYGLFDGVYSTKTITYLVASHSKPIHIQARCPDTIINNKLAQADNIQINVEE